MGKPFAVVALIFSAFCFSSVLGRSLTPAPAQKEEQFFVEGKIYCDPCQVQFETRLSYPLSGVNVTLQCTKPDTDNLTYVNEGYTDENGIYSLAATGDHEDEICELKTAKSTHADCNVMMAADSDRIVLTKNNGDSSSVRFVNPLGYMTKGIDNRCADVINELGLDNIDI